jgi:DNA-binding IclR family transcriptional regulator
MHNPTLRVTEVLNYLSKSASPMRLSDISRELNMPKSTLVPILQTLVSCQYIGKDGADRYFPGFALLALGTAARNAYGPSKFMKEHLKNLVEKFNETCYYGVLEGNDVLYLEKIDSPQPLRILTEIGRRLPAYATGLGKALLMEKTKEELQNLYHENMKPLTANTITDPDILYAQLQKAKTLGYTWEMEESTAHIRCFAVPVRQNGNICGAVSIAIPVFRYQETEKESIIQALKKTAAAIENGMQLMI